MDQLKAFCELLCTREEGDLFDFFWQEDLPGEAGSLTHKWCGEFIKKNRSSVIVHFFHEQKSTVLPEYIVEKKGKVVDAKLIGAIEDSKSPASAQRFFFAADAEPPPSGKRNRSEASSSAAVVATAVSESLDSKSDGIVWETLASGLKVPAHIDEPFNLFYAHLWGPPDEEKWERLYNEFKLKYMVHYRTEQKLVEQDFFKATFKQFVFYNFRIAQSESTTASTEMSVAHFKPSTKEEFRPIFLAAIHLFASLAVGATPPARTDAWDKCVEAFNSGKIDFQKMWVRPSNETPEDSGMSKRIATLEKQLADAKAERTTQPERYVYIPEQSSRGYSGRGGRGGLPRWRRR